MESKLKKILAGEAENHILPFFWQHGEDDSTLISELHNIYNSGVKAVCIESRPHEDFAGPGWFSDVKVIMDECIKLGMDAWILDDKYFPTGFCNGAIVSKAPDRCKRVITEKHMDICGPVTESAVIVEGWADETKEEEIIAVIACRAEDRGETLTGECIDITEDVSDGLLYVTLPDGMWRIFFIIEKPERDKRVDFTNPESVDMMFSEIYEPHYENLKEYFGSPFKGFFSDEPFILDHASLPLRNQSKPHARYPWNKYIKARMAEKEGDSLFLHIPSLWFNMTGISPSYRIDYMDTITMLYKECFSQRVGDWCRERGVMYIGHVVEDFNQHSNFNSGGHYFRALDGQDMAGADVVLHQIVPGMSDYANACNCWYDVADPDLFTFSLAKMASSHAHIQKEKKGRAMCEIYGAYGWAEGLKMMKWLTDHMLVRGINNFVPHAFSPMFPDEVPPQFYGAGHNPQYRQFRLIMEYMNRVSSLHSDGRHKCSAAILYHAEAEWSGGEYDYFYTCARMLTLSNIDFDIISADYLLPADVRDGEMVINEESYPCVLVPYSEYLPEKVTEKLDSLAGEGVCIIFVGKAPEKTAENSSLPLFFKNIKNIFTVREEKLGEFMRSKGFFDITSSEKAENMRFYHYVCGKTDSYMITNEGIKETINTSLSFSAFSGGRYAVYYPMENRAYEGYSEDGIISLCLEPYEERMFFFGEIPNGLEKYCNFTTESETEINFSGARLSLYECENYPDKAEVSLTLDRLKNICSKDMFPHFGGYMVYETEFIYEKKDGNADYILDLGECFESAEVFLNGEKAGDRVAPPYRFDITSLLKNGENSIKAVITNNLAYEQRDLCSKFLVLERTGLIGPVSVKVKRKKQ